MTHSLTKEQHDEIELKARKDADRYRYSIPLALRDERQRGFIVGAQFGAQMMGKEVEIWRTQARTNAEAFFRLKEQVEAWQEYAGKLREALEAAKERLDVLGDDKGFSEDQVYVQVCEALSIKRPKI